MQAALQSTTATVSPLLTSSLRLTLGQLSSMLMLLLALLLPVDFSCI
jgi:hypothetical protein